MAPSFIFDKTHYKCGVSASESTDQRDFTSEGPLTPIPQPQQIHTPTSTNGTPKSKSKSKSSKRLIRSPIKQASHSSPSPHAPPTNPETQDTSPFPPSPSFPSSPSKLVIDPFETTRLFPSYKSMLETERTLHSSQSKYLPNPDRYVDKSANGNSMSMSEVGDRFRVSVSLVSGKGTKTGSGSGKKSCAVLGFGKMVNADVHRTLPPSSNEEKRVNRTHSDKNREDMLKRSSILSSPIHKLLLNTPVVTIPSNSSRSTSTTKNMRNYTKEEMHELADVERNRVNKGMCVTQKGNLTFDLPCELYPMTASASLDFSVLDYVRDNASAGNGQSKAWISKDLNRRGVEVRREGIGGVREVKREIERINVVFDEFEVYERKLVHRNDDDGDDDGDEGDDEYGDDGKLVNYEYSKQSRTQQKQQIEITEFDHSKVKVPPFGRLDTINDTNSLEGSSVSSITPKKTTMMMMNGFYNNDYAASSSLSLFSDYSDNDVEMRGGVSDGQVLRMVGRSGMKHQLLSHLRRNNTAFASHSHSYSPMPIPTSTTQTLTASNANASASVGIKGRKMTPNEVTKCAKSREKSVKGVVITESLGEVLRRRRGLV